MKIIKKDEPYIYDLRKSETEGTVYLNWQAIEFRDFLVIRSNSKKFPLEELDRLTFEIDRKKDELIAKKYAEFGDFRAQLVDIVALRKNGGISTENCPGYYTVFGISFIDLNDFNLYAFADSDEENSIKLKIELTVSQKPQMRRKEGFLFLKNKDVYSGYKRVSFDKKISNIKCGDLFYRIHGKNYPVPTDALKKSGYFFVKADENEQIEFGTSIKEIILK